jgi:hypothetical protein
MTLEHDLLQLARDAIRSLMSGRDFAVGQTGHYLNIISRIEDELNRPHPKQEFYPDWDMLKPYHERIKELEEQLAKPEQEPVGQFVGGIPEVSQQREWVGLSDKDCDKAWEHAQMSSPYGVTRIEVFAKDIERRLKERNNAV